MKFTPFIINGKPLAALSIGCMRFQSEEETASVINRCVENGASYLDTSPSYCFQTEEENCEAWVGRSIKHIREEVILSAKSSPGNGGFKMGNLDINHGFSVNRADDVRRTIEQSLTRMDVNYLDCYQMWSVNNASIFYEAIKPNGWLEGVLKAKSEGLLKHIGITGHADVDTWKMFIDSGYFKMITLPFNMFCADRIPCIKYALSKNIAVLAMNPLGGGLLTIKTITIFTTCLNARVSKQFQNFRLNIATHMVYHLFPVWRVKKKQSKIVMLTRVLPSPKNKRKVTVLLCCKALIV